MTSLFTVGRELPEGWAKVTLEELVMHALGGDWGESPKESEKKPGLVPVRVLRSTEFRNWEREKGATAALRMVQPSSLEKRRLAAGDLVVEVSGGGKNQPVGRALLLDEEAVAKADAPLICSNFCRHLRLRPEVDPAYVHLALTYLYLNGDLDEYQTQTTNLRNLRFPSFLAGVVLRLPPRPEQTRIVARSRELFATIERTRQQLSRVPPILREFRQSVLDAAYTGRLTEEWREEHKDLPAIAGLLPEVFRARRDAHDMICAEGLQERAPRRPKNLKPTPWEAPEPLDAPEPPEGWSLLALQDLVDRAQYGLSTRSSKQKRKGLPMLRMANIQAGRLDLTDLKYVHPDPRQVDDYRLHRGDVLFNRTNSPELVGKAAVFDADLDAVFASYVVRIQCDERLVSSDYVCGWINSPWGRRWARTVKRDCVSQSNINVSRLMTMPVPVPPLAEQLEIVRRVADLFTFAVLVEERLAAAQDKTSKIWRRVLARALDGRLVSTEAELAREEEREYEQAADLLDRIGAERLARAASRRAGSGELTEGVLSPVVLAAIRQTCWGAGTLSPDDLIRTVAKRLGCRLGKSVRAQLEKHLEAALERRIIERRGDLLTGATPTIGRYDYDFLMRTVYRMLAPGETRDAAELIEAMSIYLGYSQVTPAIRERMEKVFRWAEQSKALVYQDGRVQRPG